MVGPMQTSQWCPDLFFGVHAFVSPAKSELRVCPKPYTRLDPELDTPPKMSAKESSDRKP